MYTFKSLPRGSFRLLRLSPRVPLNEGYELVSFKLDQCPCFNALSYCWGDLARSSSFQCNGETMMITPHLKEAMNHLRLLKRETEWIWVDQICINQDDDIERAIQVNMMKDIYTSSQGTIIWLGSDVSHIETVPTLIEHLSTFHIRDMNPDGTRKRSRYTRVEYMTLQLPPAQDPAWSALGNILSRPWFVRSWVIQEIALSRCLPRVICGDSELSWENLVSAALWILDISYEFTPLSLNAATMPALRSLKFSSELVKFGLPWDLTTLLNKSIQSRASEPRDRIYSLLALTNELADIGKSPLALRANYKKPVEIVFRDVTRYIILSTRTLRVLSLLRYTPSWNKFPSWVIDFSANAGWERISYFSWDINGKSRNCLREVPNDAAKGHPVAVMENPLNDYILGLQGLEIDTIDEICGVMKKDDDISCTSGVWLAWKKACQRLATRYHTHEAITRAFMVTLTADWSLSDSERISDLPLVYFWRYLSDICYKLGENLALLDDAKHEGAHVKDFISLETVETHNENIFSLHLDAAHKRRLFFTRNMAYIGLGPEILQKDDILCVLFGGATPMILRPSGGYYRFVGECYVFDLMKGEAIEAWNSGRYVVKTFRIY